MVTPKTMTDAEWEVVQSIMRTAIATYLLGHMLDTPTHGLTGQASKEIKVKAAFDYADLLMKG